MADALLTVSLAVVVVLAVPAAVLLAVPSGARRSVLVSALLVALAWTVVGGVGLATGDTVDGSSLALLVAGMTALGTVAAVPLSASGASVRRVAPVTAAWTVVVAGPLVLALFSSRDALLLSAFHTLDYGGALASWLPLGVLAVAVRVLARSTPAAVPSRGRAFAAVGLLWIGAVAWLVAVELRLDEDTPKTMLAALTMPLCGVVGWLLVQRIARARSSWIGALAGFTAGIAATFPAAPYLDPSWAPVLGVLAGAAGAAVVDPHRSRVRVMVGATAVPAAVAVLFLGVFAADRGLVYVGGLDGLMSQLTGLALALGWSIVASAPFVAIALHRRRAVVRRAGAKRGATRRAGEPESPVRTPRTP